MGWGRGRRRKGVGLGEGGEKGRRRKGVGLGEGGEKGRRRKGVQLGGGGRTKHLVDWTGKPNRLCPYIAKRSCVEEITPLHGADDTADLRSSWHHQSGTGSGKSGSACGGSVFLDYLRISRSCPALRVRPRTLTWTAVRISHLPSDSPRKV